MWPRWKEIESENSWLKTEFYDYDESPEIVEKYKIDENIPCFIFLDKNEKELLRLNGEFSKEELLKIIGKYKDM